LAAPVPSPPALVQGQSVQNELIATIVGALKLASIIITVVNGSVILASTLITSVIEKLSSICNTEVFEVSTITQLALDQSNFGYTASRFYNIKNVSIEDLDNRELLIQQLNSKQLSIIDNLLELPSKVIKFQGTNPPDSSAGKQGDYAINETTKTFYGPKVSDTEWGTGINY
jgi:hypothetical protein